VASAANSVCGCYNSAVRILLILACALGIAVNCFLYRPVLGYIIHGNNDFVCYYAAAQLSGTPALYDEPAMRRAEIALGDHNHAVVFTRLPFYAAWISPLRFFNFDLAYLLWQALSLSGVLLFIWFWPSPDRWITALVCCWSLPLLEAFISGQDVTLLLAALAVSMWLRSRGRHFAAGCAFAVCSVKYHLFLTFPLLLLVRRMGRFTAGLAAGGAVLAVWSFGVAGWSWPRPYIAILTRPDTTPDWTGMPNIRGMVVGLAHDRLWELLGAALVLIAAWIVIRGKQDSLAIAATLASGLLLGHHAFLRDAVLLLPVCLLMWQSSCGAPCRAIALLMFSPLPYLLFLLPDPPLRPAVLIPLPLLAMAAATLYSQPSVLWGSHSWLTPAFSRRPRKR
jgi:hypothetical protein